MAVRSLLVAGLLVAGSLNGDSALAEEVLNFNASKRSCVAHAHSSWGYYGQLSRVQDGTRQQVLLPNDWGHRYEACGRALAPLHRQSPIELPDGEALPNAKGDNIVFGGDSTAQILVEHNCHTVQATVLDSSVSTMRLAGQEYRMLQFHVHTPSEHVIDGGEAGTSNYPGEIHFVHAALNEDGSIDGNRLAVVGVFLDVAKSAPLDRVDRFFSKMAGDYAGAATTPGKPIAVNLDEHTRDRESYWRYQGSLTTPPCSESVEWVVLKDPLVISENTFRALQSAKLDVGFANSRPPFLPTAHHQLRFSRH